MIVVKILGWLARHNDPVWFVVAAYWIAWCHDQPIARTHPMTTGRGFVEDVIDWS